MKKKERDLFGGMIDLKIVNLIDTPRFMTEYVDLRNRYTKELLTAIVTVDETVAWLNGSNVHVLIAENGDELLGAIILYLDKNGEIAIFTKYQGKQIASALLQNMKNVAKKIYSLQSLWCWVANNNHASLRVFIKNDFVLFENTTRRYGNISIAGQMLKCEI